MGVIFAYRTSYAAAAAGTPDDVTWEPTGVTGETLLWVQPVTSPTGEVGVELQFDEALSSLIFTGHWVYDAGTACTVEGTTMHCCPSGMAMIGIHASRNIFKCAELREAARNSFLDTNTVRNSMHACPRNRVMVGFHQDLNRLACQTPNPTPLFEFVDGTTNDVFPMHVCPENHAMSGIHVELNLLTCAL